MRTIDLVLRVKEYMLVDKYPCDLTKRLAIASYQIAQGFEWSAVGNASEYESYASAIIHFLYAGEVAELWLENVLERCVDDYPYQPALIQYKAWMYHMAKCMQQSIYYTGVSSRRSRFNAYKLHSHIESCIYNCFISIPKDGRIAAFDTAFDILRNL